MIPKNHYSCFVCQKEFVSKDILVNLWFCKDNCKFDFSFQIVNSVFPNAPKEIKDKLSKRIMEVSLK